MLKKLIDLLKTEWRAAFDPKIIVINDIEDLKNYAEALKYLSIEEREMLLEFVTQAEIGRQTERDTAARYGVTVGEAIEHQRTIKEIESSVASIASFV